MHERGITVATIAELIEERKSIALKGQDIRARMEVERRELSDEERDQLRYCIARGTRLSEEIDLLRGVNDLDERTYAPHRPGMRPEPGDSGGDNGGSRYQTPTGKRFASFGEQLQAVYRQATHQGTDSRLTYVSPEQRALGITESVGSDGGFLVQPEFANEVYKRSYETGQVSARCRKFPIGASFNSVKIPAINESSRVDGSRWGGVLSYWVGEGQTYTPTRPKFRLMDLTLKKLVGLAYATDEMLQDSALLESIIMQAFSEEIGFKTDQGAIRGPGAGEMLGILNAPALYTVAAEGAQPTATIVSANVYKMYQHMWARSRLNAVWFINQEIETQLNQMVTGTATVNQAVYLPPGAMSASPYAVLLGRPVIPIEQCSGLGTVGDIILADMGQYAIADKGGTQVAASMHVAFLTEEQVFRFTYRVEGQPLWQLPLTPFLGGNVVSAYVALATRP